MYFFYCVCRCISRCRLKTASVMSSDQSGKLSPDWFRTPYCISIIWYMNLELLNGWETYGGREQRESGLFWVISFKKRSLWTLNSVILTTARHLFIYFHIVLPHQCSSSLLLQAWLLTVVVIATVAILLTGGGAGTDSQVVPTVVATGWLSWETGR